MAFQQSKADVEYLFSLLNKYVEVKLIRKFNYTGFVNCIDPVTLSIVLLKPIDNEYQTLVIPGHAILDITEVQIPENIKCPPNISNTETAIDSAEILEKKKKTMAWLEKNLLTITESEGNIVIENVHILPPYTSKDICTSNLIVAMQIGKILDKMPPDDISID